MQDLSTFQSSFSFGEKIQRLCWNLVQATLFRYSLRPFFVWRIFLLKLFGAKIQKGVRIYPSTKIFYPKNLSMDEFAILGPDVDCYNVAPIHIGAHSMVSQYSYLCAASHEHNKTSLPLIAKPITIAKGVWVCADVFVAMGVHIADNAVVAARSTVLSDIPADKVYGGYPAREIKDRTFI